MTDVIELAKERRALVAAEVAKLDNFLRMAMALAEPGDDRREKELAGLGSGAGEHDDEHDDELILTDMLTEDTGETDIHIGKMIRHRRWMMGMTQEQLSEMVGIDIDHIQSYESGIRHVSTSVLRNIALAMEVPVSFFLEEFDEESPDEDSFYNDILPDR